MVINFKKRIYKIYKNESKSINTFHFYKNYQHCKFIKMLRCCNANNISYYRLNKDYVNDNLYLIEYICLLSDKFINNEQLVFLAELEKNHIFCLSLAKYDNYKLIIDEKYNIYNWNNLTNINFYNHFIIKKEILRRVKKQLNNIIKSRNILSKL